MNANVRVAVRRALPVLFVATVVLSLMAATAMGASIPNPAPASDPDINQRASDAIGLVKLLGLLGAGLMLVVGASMVAIGNKGGNHSASGTGKQMMVMACAGGVLVQIAIPVFNRVFV